MPFRPSSRLALCCAAAGSSIGVAAAAVFFLNAVGGGRAANHSPTLGRVLSALGQRAARSDAMPSTDRKLFYTRIAYRDLAVRVDARRGPWAARYRQVVR